MSQNENIEFACPSCNTGLNVPAHLAGITGPCPFCQASITAPHPTPATLPAQAVHYSEPQAPQYQQPAQPAYPEPLTQAPQAPENAQAAAIPSERPAGTPPHSQPISSPSQPTPSRAAPVEMAPAQAPPVKRRKVWPTILFPALFLLLAAAVVYLILDLMGILNFSSKAPEIETNDPIPKIESPASDSLLPASEDPVTPLPEPDLPDTAPPEPIALPQELEHDPQDLKKDGEVGTDLPDLTQQNLAPEVDSVKKRTAAIKEAREVLKRFLIAQTFEERKPLITQSSHSDEFLAASCLGKPFPRSFEPTLAANREREADRSFEVFFSVVFEQPEESRSKIIMIRTITYSDTDSPKIHTDPFIDLYEGAIQQFHDNKEKGTGTFSSLVELSAYCFDDIPKAKSMAKVSFFTDIKNTDKPIAVAYLSKGSSPFKQLADMAKANQRIPATVSVAWDTETDSEKPYLQVIRVEALNWSL